MDLRYYTPHLAEPYRLSGTYPNPPQNDRSYLPYPPTTHGNVLPPVTSPSINARPSMASPLPTVAFPARAHRWIPNTLQTASRWNFTTTASTRPTFNTTQSSVAPSTTPTPASNSTIVVKTAPAGSQPHKAPTPKPKLAFTRNPSSKLKTPAPIPVPQASLPKVISTSSERPRLCHDFRVADPERAFFRPKLDREESDAAIPKCSKCRGWGGILEFRTFDTTSRKPYALRAKCDSCLLSWSEHVGRQFVDEKHSTLTEASTLAALARTGPVPAAGQRQKRIILKLPKLITCDICSEEKLEKEFPVLVTLTCNHKQATCLTCIQAWIGAQIDDGTTSIGCPAAQCGQKLETEDIQRQAAEVVYQDYLDLSLKQSLAKDATFRYCMNALCGSGQYVPDGHEEFECDECRMVFCLAHQPMVNHDGETCTSYTARMAIKRKHEQDREDEEASQAEVKRISTECPGCHIQIQKSAGCDHMTCQRCKYEFCYVCGADYNKIREHGNTEHEGVCRYHSSNLHPERDWIRPPRPPRRPRAPPAVGTRASARIAVAPRRYYTIPN